MAINLGMSFEYDRISTVHLEVTSRCNASCPMCARNINGGKVIPSLKLTSLSVDAVREIFPVDFVRRLNRLYMCGNYGDPIAARDTLEIFTYLRSCNAILTLGMSTNGSARSPEWGELGKLFSQDTDAVKFSIDGLSDTNHIYRRGTDFDKIMRNANAFIAAGGRAAWDFLVFSHNEHQVEEAKRLACDLGFVDFQVKKTGRFRYDAGTGEPLPFPIKDQHGMVIGHLGAARGEYRSATFRDKQVAERRFGSLKAFYDMTPIDCKAINDNSIYIDANGYVLPCCWVGDLLYSIDDEEHEKLMAIIDAKGGSTMIDAKKRPLREIVEGPVFQMIAAGWSDTLDGARLRPCSFLWGDRSVPCSVLTRLNVFDPVQDIASGAIARECSRVFRPSRIITQEGYGSNDLDIVVEPVKENFSVEILFVNQHQGVAKTRFVVLRGLFSLRNNGHEVRFETREELVGGLIQPLDEDRIDLFVGKALTLAVALGEPNCDCAVDRLLCQTTGCCERFVIDRHRHASTKRGFAPMLNFTPSLCAVNIISGIGTSKWRCSSSI